MLETEKSYPFSFISRAGGSKQQKIYLISCQEEIHEKIFESALRGQEEDYVSSCSYSLYDVHFWMESLTKTLLA